MRWGQAHLHGKAWCILARLTCMCPCCSWAVEAVAALATAHDHETVCGPPVCEHPWDGGSAVSQRALHCVAADVGRASASPDAREVVDHSVTQQRSSEKTARPHISARRSLCDWRSAFGPPTIRRNNVKTCKHNTHRIYVYRGISSNGGSASRREPIVDQKHSQHQGTYPYPTDTRHSTITTVVGVGTGSWLG